ncbi:hypothetical protein GF376_02450 [Candidatus Peregrinibacteria bacterium]|nr:hypothetical protein [Candidatus Peregrinibacteria bacterium]
MPAKRCAKLKGDPTSELWVWAFEQSGYSPKKYEALFKALRTDSIAPDGQPDKKWSLVNNNNWWLHYPEGQHMQLCVLCWLLAYYRQPGYNKTFGRRKMTQMICRRITVVSRHLHRNIRSIAPILNQQRRYAQAS